MQFRTDINGLRAYAVLAVMLFHFNKDWLPGGFVGVDVFFVISGYLMTSIIFRGLDNRSFSILKFYAARVRRIIPALLVVIIILVALGYFFLGTISYRNLTKEAIRSLFFVSNFLYWRDAGYFDASAFSKPLLHTWSLSVEWQFYIIYPIILAIFAKFCSIRTLKRIVLAAMLISLGFTAYFSYQSPITAYFLLPTRIWEMLLGGLIFLYPLQFAKSSHKYALEILGIILILVSTFVISENIPWPGYMALLPTVGAFILMQANGSSILTNNIVFQKIGLWSYSLYLYHWPIIFINHRYNLDMNVWIFFTLSFILAITSYYLIELRKWKVKYIIITMCIVLVPLYGIYKTQGASFRVSNKYKISTDEFSQKYTGGGMFPAYEIAYTNPKKNNDFDYTILGDSYSRQHAYYLINNKISAQTWFADACLFTKDYTVYLDKKELEKCTKFVDLFFEYTKRSPNQQPIVWIQSWDGYNLTKRGSNSNFLMLKHKDTRKQFLLALEKTIQTMVNANQDRNIYLVGVYTRPNYNIYECISEKELTFFSETCDEFIPYQNNLVNNKFEEIAAQYPNVYFIDPNKGLCSEQGCRMLINNEPMFIDMGHLSSYGSNIVGKYIFDEVQKNEEAQHTVQKQD